MKALDFVDEIIVADSSSTDETVKIAERYGAKVFQRDFISYGEQKNGADLATGPWILNIDADEVVSDELKSSIKQVLKEDPSEVFEVDRLNYFCERPIRHGGWYPD